MKNVKVLGSGCANCRTTIQLVEAVAKEAHIEIVLEKVEDMAAIVAYGVMRTPAVVVDGAVVHSGGIPERAAIASWLK